MGGVTAVSYTHLDVYKRQSIVCTTDMTPKILGIPALGVMGYVLSLIHILYLDYATRQARRHIPMTMEDWKTKLDAFLRFNDAEVLKDKGKVTAAIAKEFAESEFEKYRVIQDSPVSYTHLDVYKRQVGFLILLIW